MLISLFPGFVVPGFVGPGFVSTPTKLYLALYIGYRFNREINKLKKTWRRCWQQYAYSQKHNARQAELLWTFM